MPSQLGQLVQGGERLRIISPFGLHLGRRQQGVGSDSGRRDRVAQGAFRVRQRVARLQVEAKLSQAGVHVGVVQPLLPHPGKQLQGLFLIARRLLRILLPQRRRQAGQPQRPFPVDVAHLRKLQERPEQGRPMRHAPHPTFPHPRGEGREGGGRRLVVNGDAVVGESQMRDVGGRTRHVALHAIVGRTFPLAPVRVHGAGSRFVTLQTDRVIICGTVLGRRLAVRVVTSQAGKRARLPVAAAQVHLLDVADHRHRRVRRFERVILAEVLERKAGAEVGQLSPAVRDRGDGLQVTLLADGLGKLARQVGRVDDGVIDGLPHLRGEGREGGAARVARDMH